MVATPPTISSLPTRYEPLIQVFGDKAKTTFVSPDEDLEVIKRVLAAAQSSAQGKILFVRALSGAGKSTFVHSLEIYLPDKIDRVIRLPQPHELNVSDITRYLSEIPATSKFTIVNFDGREAPYFDEREYQTFLGALNSLLRTRKDLIVMWPVTDESFSAKLIELLRRVGGESAFALMPEYELNGIQPGRFRIVLEKLLQVANWRLEDAAISHQEVDDLIGKNARIGGFLDSLQQLIAKRFDIGHMGVEFPTLLLAISSGDPKIRETLRSLRRADSYYIESSRLMMYTKRSNVAEWWENRATSLKSALPHVIALFNAQLVSLSASSVIHAVQQSDDEDLKTLVTGVRADRGNAGRVISSSELYKYLTGQAIDNREYGSSVKEDTYSSYERIQGVSDIKHRAINAAILSLAQKAGASLPALKFEETLVTGLQTDATLKEDGKPTIAIEFHHKARAESTPNKIAIYILEKLKEYAINYGLASR